MSGSGNIRHQDLGALETGNICANKNWINIVSALRKTLSLLSCQTKIVTFVGLVGVSKQMQNISIYSKMLWVHTFMNFILVVLSVLELK